MIYIFTMPGCDACEAAEPEIDTFAAQHPLEMILRVRADGPIAKRLGVKIQATPTYMAVDDHGQGIQHVGMMTAAQMEKWISKGRR